MVESYAAGKQQRSSTHVRPAVTCFEDQVALGVEEGADLILLTGDNLNFPSPRAVAHMVSVLEGSGIPFMYISGNHDWDMHAQPGPPDERRAGWQSSVLAPLYAGRDPDAWTEVFGGVRLVAIDNSVGQVTPAQLEFFRQATATDDLPVMLLLHIPLFVPQLKEAISSGPFSRRPMAEPEPAANGGLMGDPDAEEPNT